MSTFYDLEPQPTAKVLLSTTSGDLLLELFAKQIPLASRSFLQHCLDGYYDGTIFHRLVPGFIIQGGDPTGTGEGGESIYEGGTFDNEFHSRLKWNRRGLLGMANEGRKNTNGSQFFFSLADCKELEGRNTLFGRIAGDTIFNLLKIGEAELGEDERPLYPTKITSTEVLVNPFEDMVKTEKKKSETSSREGKRDAKKGKKKAGKSLLSFDDGEDGEDGNERVIVKKQKFNTKLVADGEEPILKADGRPQSSKPAHTSSNGIGKSQSALQSVKHEGSSEPQLVAKPPDPNTQLPLPNTEQKSQSTSTSPEPEQVERVSTMLEKTNAQIAELKAAMKRSSHTVSTKDSKPKSALEEMIPATAIQGKKRKQGAAGNSDEQRTLRMLSAFKQKLENVPADSNTTPQEDAQVDETRAHEGDKTAIGDPDEEAALCDLHFIANCQSCMSWDKHGQEDDQLDDKDEQGWMSHTLSFEKDRLGKDLTFKRKAEEELVVIDPREKAMSIKEEKKARTETRKGGSAAFAPSQGRGGRSKMKS